MFFQKACIPYGGYWSTPFCRWQENFAHLNAVPFAAEITLRALEERGISPQVFDSLYLGLTVPQKHSFYGGPWLAGLIGAEAVTGPIISQACATGARVVASAAAEVEVSKDRTILTISADKCSNGPHVYYPNPLAPGGTGDKEDWVWDNFGHDPFARNAMIETAENVAKEAGITKEEQDELTLLRHQQYGDALKDEAAFHRRYMVAPSAEHADGRSCMVGDGLDYSNVGHARGRRWHG